MWDHAETYMRSEESQRDYVLACVHIMNGKSTKARKLLTEMEREYLQEDAEMTDTTGLQLFA